MGHHRVGAPADVAPPRSTRCRHIPCLETTQLPLRSNRYVSTAAPIPTTIAANSARSTPGFEPVNRCPIARTTGRNGAGSFSRSASSRRGLALMILVAARARSGLFVPFVFDVLVALAFELVPVVFLLEALSGLAFGLAPVVLLVEVLLDLVFGLAPVVVLLGLVFGLVVVLILVELLLDYVAVTPSQSRTGSHTDFPPLLDANHQTPGLCDPATRSQMRTSQRPRSGARRPANCSVARLSENRSVWRV